MDQHLWHTRKIDEVFKHFESDMQGLSSIGVLHQRAKYGQNVILKNKPPSRLILFLRQFQNAFMYILIVAAAVVFFLGEYVDGGIILFIIILNAFIGAIQEGKAQDTLSALKDIIEDHATVVRNGKPQIIPAQDVVPGDILILKDGEKVTADARLFESNSLKVQESALSGESEEVFKDHSAKVAGEASLADQATMVFKGTQIMAGFGKAVVIATGMNTALGQIADELDELHKDIPLQKNIADLTSLIIKVVGVFAVVIFFIGLLNDKTISEMFLIGVALAISAIPESLPVVVTLVLATGVWRMSQQNTLVKRLQAVEALGGATIIALDKTGTITKNQMTVEMVYVDGKTFEISGSGYTPEGNILYGGSPVVPATSEALLLAGKISAFTAQAHIAYSEERQEWQRVSGDPTEVALLVLGKKMGLEKDDLERQYLKIQEFPFDLKTQKHTAINLVEGKQFLTTAGGPEGILQSSKFIWREGKQILLDMTGKNELRSVVSRFTRDGYRVLALAANFNPPQAINPFELPELVFVGLVAIRDAIRPEVYDALKAVKAAGLRPVMITGDHADTACAIATQVGIFKKGDTVLTGSELETLSDSELRDKLSTCTVFARVAPEQKLKIIRAYQKQGEVVAMTGDGINDALSLVAADLGVAMGKSGTEVAKEAADIILLDDNFGTIASAVEEGRNIYSTIYKSILYLLSTNLGELLVIGIAVAVRLPLPLVATQIIWLNMITDSFLVAALALEPKEKGSLMNRRPKTHRFFFDKGMTIRIFLVSGIMTIVTLVLFVHYLPEGIVKATTIALTVLTVFQWFNIFNVRSAERSAFSNIFRNKYIFIGLGAAITLQLLALYTPFMQKVLKTTGLSLKEWGVILVAALTIIAAEEIRKIITRKFKIIS